VVARVAATNLIGTSDYSSDSSSYLEVGAIV
jgi:hypothetical protein